MLPSRPQIVCVLVVVLYAAASVINAAALYAAIEEIAGVIDRMKQIRIVIGSLLGKDAGGLSASTIESRLAAPPASGARRSGH